MQQIFSQPASRRFSAALAAAVFSLLFAAASPAAGRNFGQHDFRNATWGMSRQAVKQTENSRLLREDAAREVLIYASNLRGRPSELRYVFSENRLRRGGHLVTGESPEQAAALAEECLENLARLYGEPNKSQLLGQTGFSHFWDTLQSTIVLVFRAGIYAEDHEEPASVLLQYEAKALP